MKTQKALINIKEHVKQKALFNKFISFNHYMAFIVL